MFNLNKTKPGYVPAHFIETVLEFTPIGKMVEIKNRANGERWQVEAETAAFLLSCSYKDYEGNIRLIGYNEADNLFREGRIIAFAGFFPYDQIVLQQHGVDYNFYRDHTARKLVRINDEIFYLCLVRQKDYPIGPCKDRPRNNNMPADTNAEDWESFSDEYSDWSDWDDTHGAQNKQR